MSRYVHSTVTHSPGWKIAADPVAVDEALHGRKVRLVPAELRRVTEVLTRRGWSSRSIAEHVGCSSRAVVRHRSALRGQAGQQ